MWGQENKYGSHKVWVRCRLNNFIEVFRLKV